MPLTIPQRKAALVLREITLADIARDLGVTYQHVWQVVVGRRRSARVEEAIAERIGKPPEKVFGPRAA
jgi:Ner family transcriptional regulator